MGTQPKVIFDMIEGYSPAKNLLGIGDPNVHKIDGQWWMFFGAMQPNFTNNLFWATLPKGESLNTGMQWQIVMDPTNPKKAQSLVQQPNRGQWDHFGLHEPCYVEGKKRDGAGKWVPSSRIYYSGRTRRSLSGKNTKYYIGLLELTADGWQRHGAPVITGEASSHSALAPKVIYDDDEKKWRIWYLSDAREPVEGDKDAADIYYSESDDGIAWQAPKSFFSSEFKFTHAHVHRRRSDGTYQMLLSKMPPSFSGEASYPEQKLWISTAQTPSGNRADWSDLHEVLAAKGGQVWYTGGFFGSSICEADAQGEEGAQYIFFAGVRGSFNWPKLATKRLQKHEGLPHLAPFYFAIGFFKVW